ncbi:MAG TPA: peroxiredoxin [Candidatus Dormibacteraeota bacterium]|nr:peroxiredoxin [Candidatus Dormibacteraeota bacterium]
MAESGWLSELPQGLPVPQDDGAAAHLRNMRMPRISLRSTRDRAVDVGDLGRSRTVIYIYPRTGRPDRPVPAEWDAIPGARGCTPESCGFRDHFAEITRLGANVFGLSTQHSDYQKEAAERLHLPFELLSDSDFALTDALRLPTFEFEGERLLKRLTLIVRDGRVEHVFYPVFPPDQHAETVFAWLSSHQEKG